MLAHFCSIVDLGTKHDPSGAAQKTYMLNIIVLLTIIIALGYTSIYLFILKHPTLALYNAILTCGYIFSLTLNT